METLLSKRYKYLSLILVGLLLFILISLHFFRSNNLSESQINKFILKKIKGIEIESRDKVQKYIKRANQIYSKYKMKKLEHSDLSSNESLIVTDKGGIFQYFGEIFHFKPKNIDINKWIFINKNERIYFLLRKTEHIFYLKYIFCLKDNFILKRLNYLFFFGELKFSAEQIHHFKSNPPFDSIKKIFFYNHLLDHTNRQLILHLKFLKKDIEKYFKEKSDKILYFTVLLLLIVILFYLRLIETRTNFIKKILYLFIVIDLYFFVSLFKGNNLYLNIINIKLNSLFEVLIILLFLIAIICLFSIKIKLKVLTFFMFNLALIFIFYLNTKILAGVNFIYSDFHFGFDYLTLVIIVFLLHLVPLSLLRDVSFKKNIFNVVLFVLCQSTVLLFIYFLLKINLISILILSIIFFSSVFLKKSFLARVSFVILISISIFHLLSINSLYEKKEFINNNLKNVFLNQSNYAQFIAREIIKEINSKYKYIHEFFQKAADSDKEVEKIWRNSIALRENIASGIFIISNKGEILSHFSDQIPFLTVKPSNIFPFWSNEITVADLYGKKVSIAIASISVKRESKKLGQIIIQVLNSAELILRYKDEINIFTINKKINGMDISYIKLNEENQIVENPSNITITNISGILKNNNEWVKFKHMDLNFKGYIFKHNNNTVVIFYPENTLVKSFSEIIKIFLFLFMFLLLFSVRELKSLDWKLIYYSFSIRVFTFLILISLLTAIIFSIFSLNFNTSSSERRFRQVLFERGRAAKKTISNLIERVGEPDQDYLFELSKIYDSDVSVYKNGELWITSNIKKEINSQIPIYLHSGILSLLNISNQEFVLNKGEKGFYLFFQIYDYTFNIDFSYKKHDIYFGKGSFTDFIITLFFIMAMIGFSSAFFFRNKILSPFHSLNNAMADVEKGNLHRLEKVPSEIEIKSLFLGFNSMVEGIKEQKKSISEISRMKTLVKLGRRVAHEVKNPLTPIKLSAEQILRSIKDKSKDYDKIIKKSVNFIIDETEHLKRVSYGFLDLSRLDEIAAEKFNLLELIQEEMFSFKQIYSNINFIIKGKSENLFVFLDRIKIKQVSKNLLINSIEAIGEQKGEIKFDLEEINNRIIMKVVDNGTGMDKNELDLIFKEYYSKKDAGTGLGLFIVKRIVDLHNGKIRIESKKNEGTTVTVDLPKNVEEV